MCYDSVGLQRIITLKGISPLSHTFKLGVWSLSKVIEAVYEKGVLRPLKKLDLPEGVRVRVRIEGVYGLLRGWRVDAQKLKNELRSMHG